MPLDNLVSIKVPKIVKKMDLGDYDKSLKGQSLRVWVNPDQHLLYEYEDFQKEIRELEARFRPSGNRMLDRLLFNKRRIANIEKGIQVANLRIYAWYSKIWSQHQDEGTHVSPDEVRAFAMRMVTEADGDPAFWKFITQRTQAMIIAHMEGLEKN